MRARKSSRERAPGRRLIQTNAGPRINSSTENTSHTALTAPRTLRIDSGFDQHGHAGNEYPTMCSRPAQNRTMLPRRISQRASSHGIVLLAGCSDAALDRCTIGEFHQQLQALAGVAAIDGVGGQRDGLADVVGVSGGYQRGGGIQHDDIAARGTLSLEHGANDGGVLLRRRLRRWRRAGRDCRPNSSGVTS